MADPLRYSEPKPRTKRRWVRFSLILAAVLVLVAFVLLLALGGHTPDPGRH
jgi:hypothetical protein